MARRLTMLIAAIAAIVLVIPAAANAGTIALKEKPGQLVPVGSPLNGAGLSTTMKSSLFGTSTCSTLSFSDVVTKNFLMAESGGIFEVGHTGGGISTECHLGTSARKITGFEVAHLESTVVGSGTLAMRFSLPLGGGGEECVYPTTKMPFTYGVGSNELSYSGSMTGTPPLCGSVTISGGFVVSSGASAVRLN